MRLTCTNSKRRTGPEWTNDGYRPLELNCGSRRGSTCVLKVEGQHCDLDGVKHGCRRINQSGRTTRGRGRLLRRFLFLTRTLTLAWRLELDSGWSLCLRLGNEQLLLESFQSSENRFLSLESANLIQGPVVTPIAIVFKAFVIIIIAIFVVMIVARVLAAK